MYEVKATGQKFSSFLSAVACAQAIRSDVIESGTGVRRWTPAPKVSAARMRKHREQLAAFNAQA